MAEVMLKDMDKGVIDAAVLWGPMAGYYAKNPASTSPWCRWSRKAARA